MKRKNNLSGWYHTIIATDNDNVISVTNRDFNDSAAGFIHSFFDVPLSTDKSRIVTHTKVTDESEIYKVLGLFEDYQQYKEIEFLKMCLSYFKNNRDRKNLKLTFHNN